MAKWLPQLPQWLQLELLWLPIVLYLPVFGLSLVLGGAKTSNGSPGSPKSYLSFSCDQYLSHALVVYLPDVVLH